jgi:GSCFA family
MSYKPVLSTWTKPAGDIDTQQPDTWYRGEHCHRFPTNRSLVAADILYGWAPTEKLITSGTKVLAFGSCFAEYFIGYLASAGYNRWQLPTERHSQCGEDLLFALGSSFENIFVIVQQFRWAFNEFTPESKLWITKDKSFFEATEERREKIRHSFQQVEIFIITLGLSEVWFDTILNEPMWRTIPTRLYEPGRHVSRIASVEETVRAFYEFDRLMDAFLPDRPVIFTLSPIPFAATFRNQSPITANAVSKAVLRSAIDQFLSNDSICSKRRYHYFPSYELVLNLFERPFLPDHRHVRPDVAKTILDLFSALYTDLPASEQAPPDRNPLELLEERVRELERQLIEKEQVIQELDQEASNRLEVINRLAASVAGEATDTPPKSSRRFWL